MNVAVAMVTLHLPAARSLKDKRGTVQSLMARLRDRYNVSVAEVDEQDSPRRAVLGLSSVNTSASHAEETIQSVLRFMDRELIGRGEVVDVQHEALGGFDGE